MHTDRKEYFKFDVNKSSTQDLRAKSDHMINNIEAMDTEGVLCANNSDVKINGIVSADSDNNEGSKKGVSANDGKLDIVTSKAVPSEDSEMSHGHKAANQ